MPGQKRKRDKARYRLKKARPPIEVARAAERLARDGALVPLHALTELAGASPRALERWATEGKGGSYLDAVYDGIRGWISSRAAVARFLESLKKRAWGEVQPAEKG